MRSRLQDEIKQTRPFPNPGTEALVSVLRTAAILEHAYGEALKPHGLTLAQYNVLRILRGAGKNGLCGREVRERLVARVPDVSRLLDRMVETGLVARARDRADRRHVTARTTPKGLRLLKAATPALEAVERERTGGLTGERLQDLVDLLAALRVPD